MFSQPIDIIPLMTPQRTLGALFWSVAHGELPDDLVFLVDSLGLEVKKELHPLLNNLIDAIQTADLDPESRPALVSHLQEQLRLILQEMDNLGLSGPAGGDF